MTRLDQRHLCLIAQTLKDCKPMPGWDVNKMVQWETTVREFIVVCKRSNPRFKLHLFEKACDYVER
jgi:hypothetical protein